MFSVCLFYDREPGIYTHEFLHDQWSYIFLHFAPKTVYVVNLPDECRWKEYMVFQNVELIAINSIEEIPEEVVYITPQNATFIKGEISLYDYQHRDNVCYVFGPNDAPLNSNVAGDKVYINTASDDNFFNWVVASIVLYDRLLKNAHYR